MNKEQILAKVLELNYHGRYGAETLDVEKYNALVEALKQDIRDESNKVTGRVNTARLAKAIIKTGTRRQGKDSKMAHACTIGGIQYVLDGYRIAAFYDPVAVPEWGDPTNWFNVYQLIERSFYGDIPVALPALSDLKAEVKVAKAEKKHCLYVIENGNYGVVLNAEYLLDFMQAFPDMQAYLSNTGASAPRHPIYISADAGFGICLPINNPGLCKAPGFHHV